jgi:hypothetical protein
MDTGYKNSKKYIINKQAKSNVGRIFGIFLKKLSASPSKRATNCILFFVMRATIQNKGSLF